MKFKVGDKVVVVNDNSGEGKYVGEIGEVTFINRTRCTLEVRLQSGEEIECVENELELYLCVFDLGFSPNGNDSWYYKSYSTFVNKTYSDRVPLMTEEKLKGMMDYFKPEYVNQIEQDLAKLK